ncbi:hypothetical protein [Lacisediminihabitans sp.]
MAAVATAKQHGSEVTRGVASRPPGDIDVAPGIPPAPGALIGAPAR